MAGNVGEGVYVWRETEMELVELDWLRLLGLLGSPGGADVAGKCRGNLGPRLDLGNGTGNPGVF
jgi:hypothetical protein